MTNNNDKLADCPKCGQTLLGNVPCWSNLCRKPTVEKCNHDDCLRDGPHPSCWSYPSDKLAEARKLIEDYKKLMKEEGKSNNIIGEFPDRKAFIFPKDMFSDINKLLAAQSIISRSEQRVEDALVITSMHKLEALIGYKSTPKEIFEVLHEAITEKFLPNNHSSDAK